jgi:carbon-monoxide dehydrogenase small subunit
VSDRRQVTLVVNGRARSGWAEPRTTLADFLREELGLTGTHLGCEHGVCGACTVLMDGASVRSCLLFAVQADGHQLTTVEGLEDPSGRLHPIQEAFSLEHGLQCGFCTPGFLISVRELLEERPDPGEEEIRSWLSGNLCRCTGYQNIVAAVRRASAMLRETGADLGERSARG